MKLVKYDAACRALAVATRVDDVKAIKDKSEAMRAYARQIKNPQLEADAWEIRKRAEIRLGELSAVLEKAAVHVGKGKVRLPPSGKPKAAVLKDAGISTSAANRYEQFSKLSEREKEKRIAKGRAAIEAGKSIADAIITQDDKKERRAERERNLGEKLLALPTKKYGVVLADPEWRFEPWSRETGMDRSADNHYPTSVLEVISARDVASIAAADCVLFLWATTPMLPHALLVMAAWGFDYRSHFVWAKDRIGTGYWNRNKHELLLVGVRGKIPAPAPGDQWDSLVEAAVGEHSAKPRCFVEMIDELFPTLPKIELNCRGQPWSGWDAWGNEAASEAAE
jgi:N6-adenosine-specific RNA methylase IME4